MLEDFCDNLRIKNDDFIVMTGNFIKFLKKLKHYNKDFDLNLFLNRLIENIGGGIKYSSI